MSTAHSLSEQTVAATPTTVDLGASEKVTEPVEAADLEKALFSAQGQSVNTQSDAVNPTEGPQTASPPAGRTITGWRWFVVCVSLYVNAFNYGLDTTIAADVQGPVVQTFGDVQQVSWLGSGFMMGSVATILLIGDIYSLFNARWSFLAGIALFEVGSAICGAAPNMSALIVGRVIAGIGGSGEYLGILNYFTGLTNESERGGYIAGIGLVWGIGAVLGPVIGGAFAVSSATWRWAFYINLVIAAVFSPMLIFFLPNLKPTQGQTVKSRLGKLDWVGALLNVAVWVLFVVPLTFAGNLWKWNDSKTIGLLVAVVVTIILFALQQGFAVFTSKEHRIFPVQLLRSRTQILLYIATACTTSALFIPIYYIPLYFQFVHGDSAIQAAVRLLPFIVISMALNMAFGTLLPRIPHYALAYVVGGVMIVVGGAVLYTVGPDTPIANVYGYTVLVAIGAGATIQSGYTLATIKVAKNGHPEDIVPSIAFQNVAQIGTGAIALVISGQLFQTFALRNLTRALAGQNFTLEEIQAAVAGTQSVVFEQIAALPDHQLLDSALAGITSAIGRTYILVMTAGALQIIVGAAMRWERLFS